MLRTRLDSPTASLGVRLLPPLAAIAAIYTFAHLRADPRSGAEAAYLALAAGAVLLAAAAVAPKPGLEPAAGAVSAVLAIWALPVGPARGAVVIAVGAAALGVAAVRWFRAERAGEEPPAPTSLAPLPLVGLALGLQALLRGGELLAIGSPVRSAILFVAFPAVGALAILALERTYGRRPALLAAAAAVVVAPGLRPGSLAALVGVAAAPWALWGGPGVGLSGQLPGRLSSGARWLAAAALLAPFGWDLRAGAVALAAGLAAALGWARDDEAPVRLRAWAAPAAALAVAAVLWLAPAATAPADGGVAIARAALVVLAVPALAMSGRARIPLVLAALALALGAGYGLGVEGGLAAPAALAALAVPRGRAPIRRDDPGSAAQAAWAVTALALAGLLAAYPWLRADPLADLVPRLGLDPSPAAALLAVAAVGLVVLGARWVDARGADRLRLLGALRHPGETTAAAVIGVLILILLVTHLPAQGSIALARAPVVLDAEAPLWRARASPPPGAGSVDALVVDSSLANAVALPAGTPVATLRVRGAGGGEATRVMRVGVDTGEWAADRPDLRREPPPAPPAWLSWVAEEGGFFGRRYRALHPVPAQRGAREVEVELRNDLPDDITFTLFHVELRR